MPADPRLTRALYVPHAAAARAAPVRIQRLYYGAECCDRLLPDAAALDRVLQAAGGRPVTLVLPFLTEGALGAARALLRHAQGQGVDEVVANDLGALELAADAGFAGRLVAGRLVNRQRRGPRLARLLSRLPAAGVTALRSSHLETPAWITLLGQLGVVRAEFDLPAAGLEAPPPGALPRSLWTPDVLVTVGRLCVAAQAEDPAHREPLRVWPCSQPCRQTLAQLSHPVMPGALYSRGPAQYWENPRLPEDLPALGVDRVVQLPQVPL